MPDMAYACFMHVMHISTFPNIHRYYVLFYLCLGVPEDVYTCVPIQGSGTFAVEAVMNTTTDKKNSRVSAGQYIAHQPLK